MRLIATLPAALSLASTALACSSSGEVSGQRAETKAETEREPPREAASGAGEPATEEDPDAVALTEDMAAPHFEGGPAESAAAAFRLERWEEARSGFAAALTASAESGDIGANDRARMRLVKGLAAAELEDWDAAAELLAEARGALPLLADYIDYHMARAHYGAERFEEAADLAGGVDPESIVGADAELLVGDALRAEEDDEAAAAHYAEYLEARPDGPRRAEARYRLAEAREAIGERDEETFRHYRRVAVASPLSEWGERAEERAEAWLSEQSEDARGALAELSGEERFARGMAYFRSMRNEKAAGDLDAALASGELDAHARCEAAFHRAFAWYRTHNRERSAPLFDRAREICVETDDEDLQVRSAYLAGRSYARLGEREASIARHALVEEHHPDHSYADDARIRQAEQYERLGDDERVTELLSTLPEIYPDDDMRAEAMWRLAWRAFRAEDYEEAIEWLDRHIEVEPIAQNYWAEGQAQYWKGRAHAELGDTESSIASYEEAVRAYPLTYYSLLALNRLREDHDESFEALVAEIAGEGDEGSDDLVAATSGGAMEGDGDGDSDGGGGAGGGALSFEPRPLFGEPGFERGLELMRLGLGEAAEAEFRALGLTPPAHRNEVEDEDQADKLWAMSFLYDRAGAHATSHWPTRWHILDYKRSWPVGESRARWRIAFPNAWWDVLDRHASRRDFSTELQLALVREESAFNPLIESWANAVGLTQLILPTARRFAPDDLGVPINRETLRNPDTNARIGAEFLQFLHDRYDGHPMLMVPAYNAGEGAVDRWLRSRGHLPADAWVEALRADQPRRYTKRLLGSYFAYAYLNDGRIPELPNELPSR